jgi:hypothetical protein
VLANYRSPDRQMVVVVTMMMMMMMLMVQDVVYSMKLLYKRAIEVNR